MKKIAFAALIVLCGCGKSESRYKVSDNVIQPVVNDLDRRCLALERRIQELEKEVAEMKTAEKRDGE